MLHNLILKLYTTELMYNELLFWEGDMFINITVF
jgi:hypothetical protein